MERQACDDVGTELVFMFMCVCVCVCLRRWKRISIHCVCVYVCVCECVCAFMFVIVCVFVYECIRACGVFCSLERGAHANFHVVCDCVNVYVFCK